MDNSKDGKNNRDDWLIPGLEQRYKKAWRGLIISTVLIVILAACYLATLNIIFEWLAIPPACAAFFCLGYQDAMIRADNYILDYAGKVLLILETKLAKDKKHEPVKSD